jgi:hypothetical protein
LDSSPALKGEDLIVLAQGDDNVFARGARVESDGSFALNDVPDQPLRVRVFGLTQDSCIRAVSFGGVDSLENGFTARAGQEEFHWAALAPPLS